jgi:hypothetical protein
VSITAHGLTKDGDLALPKERRFVHRAKVPHSAVSKALRAYEDTHGKDLEIHEIDIRVQRLGEVR